MRHFFTLPKWAGLALVAAVGFTGCKSEDVAPDVPCGTTATVRFCYGYTMMCPTEHTTLELADGTRLRPRGKRWNAYLPHQIDGQVVSVGYVLTQPNANDDPTFQHVTLSCLEAKTRDGK